MAAPPLNPALGRQVTSRQGVAVAEHVKVLGDGRVQITYDTPEENPRFGEAGESVPLARNPSPESVTGAVRTLHAAAAKALPPGTVYELRSMIPGLDIGGIAWYHIDRMKDWPVTGAIPWPGEINPLGGYVKLGTFRTSGSVPLEERPK